MFGQRRATIRLGTADTFGEKQALSSIRFYLLKTVQVEALYRKKHCHLEYNSIVSGGGREGNASML
jgi:hypothetical protein